MFTIKRQAHTNTSARVVVTAAILAVAGLAFNAPAAAESLAAAHTAEANTTGELVIVKTDEAHADATAAGSAAWGAPVAGATYSIEQVTVDADGNPIDLTTPHGRMAAENLTVAAAQQIVSDDNTVGHTETAETNANGIADFTNSGSGIPTGLYLVTETDTPDGATPTEAFLVTLPLLNDTTGTWDFTAYVTPNAA
ncbi:MAG: hypothetical protein LBB54_02455 [Cellulomonadaceae bacterium]|nr:hypothetical protein [Cellulomonadaceae bacterium]